MMMMDQRKKEDKLNPNITFFLNFNTKAELLKDTKLHDIFGFFVQKWKQTKPIRKENIDTYL